MSAQEIIAKALWADGNNRIGHRPWESVQNAYMAEAGHAITALRARSFEERLHLMSSVLGVEAQLLTATMGEPGPVRYFLCDLNNPASHDTTP